MNILCLPFVTIKDGGQGGACPFLASVLKQKRTRFFQESPLRMTVCCHTSKGFTSIILFIIKGVPGPPRGAIRRSSGNHCSHPTSSFPGEGPERRRGQPTDGSFSKSGACSTASSGLAQGLTDQERGNRGGGSRDGLAAHTLLHSDTPGKPCV